MIVIGTAGHIDHGKSSIVKRLTGTDPDRLPEEKARGMTIDLGFAFYHTPDGQTLALVDVPGHERFVKNMIAGAGGIDSVMLVVAADDGWMPQSEEHFQITRLLGVRHGFVVINKIDLVEPDWLELLEQEVSQKLTGSFLDSARTFRVSAETGAGFDHLRAYLDELTDRLESRKDIGKARLAIDRSFIRPGMGGVVTGTLRGGKLTMGQPVGVWPAMITARVRTLQSRGYDVDTAVPGQRTAVSLTGVDREHLVRGGVISDRTDLTFFRDHPVLALSVEVLHNAAVPLDDRRRVLIIVGTTEVEGEVRLYDRKSLGAGQTGLVFFVPDSPVYALVGDRLVLRLPSPMITLGGGAVLDHLAAAPRRKELDRLGYLQNRMTPTLEALILSELCKKTFEHVDTLLESADLAKSDIKTGVEKLIRERRVSSFGAYLYSTERLQVVSKNVTDVFRRELEDKPHLKGLSRTDLERLLSQYGEAIPVVLDYLVDQGQLEVRGDLYDLAGRGMSLKGVIKQAHDEIIARLGKQPFDPPSLTDLASGGKVHQQAIKYIIESGEGYKCGSDFIFLADAWAQIVAFVREHLSRNERLTVADLRDKFGFTRKFGIPILEELDRLGLTAREGDYRVKGKKFET
ncbi:MAG: selenocysteine-specific translation elongation factor [Candidatus Zixiibacteriota bacterium]